MNKELIKALEVKILKETNFDFEDRSERALNWAKTLITYVDACHAIKLIEKPLKPLEIITGKTNLKEMMEFKKNCQDSQNHWPPMEDHLRINPDPE